MQNRSIGDTESLRPKLYRPSEAARALGLPLQSVYGWIRAGEIRARKIGGRYFIAPREMERLLSPEDRDSGCHD